MCKTCLVISIHTFTLSDCDTMSETDEVSLASLCRDIIIHVTTFLSVRSYFRFAQCNATLNWWLWDQDCFIRTLNLAPSKNKLIAFNLPLQRFRHIERLTLHTKLCNSTLCANVGQTVHRFMALRTLTIHIIEGFHLHRFNNCRVWLAKLSPNVELLSIEMSAEMMIAKMAQDYLFSALVRDWKHVRTLYCPGPQTRQSLENCNVGQLSARNLSHIFATNQTFTRLQRIILPVIARPNRHIMLIGALRDEMTLDALILSTTCTTLLDLRLDILSDDVYSVVSKGSICFPQLQRLVVTTSFKEVNIVRILPTMISKSPNFTDFLIDFEGERRGFREHWNSYCDFLSSMFEHRAIQHCYMYVWSENDTDLETCEQLRSVAIGLAASKNKSTHPFTFVIPDQVQLKSKWDGDQSWKWVMEIVRILIKRRRAFVIYLGIGGFTRADDEWDDLQFKWPHRQIWDNVSVQRHGIARDYGYTSVLLKSPTVSTHINMDALRSGRWKLTVDDVQR